MKSDLIVKICLVVATFLAGGALLASAAGYGFISYENGNTVMFWDNVKIVGRSLNIKSTGTSSAGTIIVGGDIYLKKFIGFGCSTNYQINQDCNTILGDAGGNGAFLKANTINSSLAITISGTSKTTSITASVLNATTLKVNNSMFVGVPEIASAPNGSVYTSTLKTDTIYAANMPGLIFEKDAVFEPKQYLQIDLTQ